MYCGMAACGVVGDSCAILMGGNRGCRAVVDMAVEIKIGK
jgi:hypothetical protein